MSDGGPRMVDLDTSRPIWDRFFSVFPLVVIGTRDFAGVVDLAPKHLAMPMSWSGHFGFVCSRRHRTYQNIERNGEFCVTYARPSQVVLASLAATPRCEDDSKPIVDALPTREAARVAGAFLEDGYVFLECGSARIYDDFGENSLIAGEVVAAQVAEDALKSSDQDDQDLIARCPLLAYLYPDRFTTVSSSQRLPFPAGFKR